MRSLSADSSNPRRIFSVTRPPAIHAFDYRFDYRSGHFRFAQQKTASAASENFFDGTTEIEVDGIISRFDQIVGGLSELLWTAADKLPSERVVVLGDLEQTHPEPSLEKYQLIEHDLGHRKFRAVATGHSAHGAVGKAGKRRLDRRHVNFERANRKHRS